MSINQALMLDLLSILGIGLWVSTEMDFINALRRKFSLNGLLDQGFRDQSR